MVQSRKMALSVVLHDGLSRDGSVVFKNEDVALAGDRLADPRGGRSECGDYHGPPLSAALRPVSLQRGRHTIVMAADAPSPANLLEGS